MAPEASQSTSLDVLIDWQAPFEQGSPISQYWVYVREKNGVTFSLPLGDCDVSLQSIVINTQCSVPVAILRAYPFNLEFGDAVVTRVVATNSVGDSLPSPDGTGTNLMTEPDPVVDLIEDITGRSASTLGLQWTDGASNGGGPIIAYQISQAVEDSTDFTVLFSVYEQSAVVFGLTYGTTYRYVVQAQNSLAHSVYSQELTLLSATVPIAPAAPATAV